MSDATSTTPASLAPGELKESSSASAPDVISTSETSATSNSATTTTKSTTGDLTAQLQNAGAAAMNTAQSTLSSISNSQAVQDIKNGPIAQNVSNEANKTTSEIKNLYTNKDIPATPAATGQSLTQYHSLFYRLLSWQNPRAIAVTFGATLALIVTARYLDVLHYAFKFAYFILGITASLEVAGKIMFNDGLATKMRPRKYWTVPRDSLERSLDDIEQLLNFFVIEAQRIVYAENVYATIGVFFAALVSYWLIKLMPFWGLACTFTCVAYLGPLVYIKNRQAIDSGLNQVSDIVSSQASQIKNITSEQTGRATDSIKTYTAEYATKAQELIGSKKSEANAALSGNDFPVAPKQDPVVNSSAAGIEPTPAQ